MPLVLQRESGVRLMIQGVCCLGVALLGAQAYGAPPGATETPWALRDHLAFPVNKALFLYDVQDAEWCVEVEELGVVVDHVGFEVVVADGTTLSAADLDKASLSREPFAAKPDKGTVFSTAFPPKNGLAIRHGVVSYETKPFLRIQMAVRNTGQAPVDIVALRPVMIGPGCMRPLSAAARVGGWPMCVRGTCAVFSKEAPSILSLFHDPAHGFCLALGVLPQGTASSGAAFQPSGGSWQGAVTSSFDPPVRLDPGATLEADPVWVSHGITSPCRVSQYYAWACRGVPGMEEFNAAPERWVTVTDDASLGALHRAAFVWASANVRHVLVPGTWEGRPGSLQGAVPRYPKDMKKVADVIRAQDMVPGLTINPLAVQKGDPDWTALSVDGRRWLNVSVAQARERGAARIRKILGWGFEFLAVQPSAIPDEILRHFNMTRVRADRLTFEMVQDAAGDVPVVPTPAAVLGADLDSWLEAASCTGAMKASRVALGPVRFDTNGLEAVDEDLAAALRFFGGPIELVGKPGKAVRERLAQLFAMPPLAASPVDAATQYPRRWRARGYNEQDGTRCDAVVMLSGAVAWNLADLGLEPDDPVSVWRAIDGAIIDLAVRPVPAAEHLTVYGLARVLPRPVLMGASVGVSLLLDDVTQLSWVETEKGEGTLSGLFQGRHGEQATAYVAIPGGWAFRSGQVGQAPLSRKAVRDRLEFAVAAGRPTRFELKFKRQ